MGVERRPLDERSADEIRAQLLSGQRPAGQRLTEQELSAELSVSRGTIRSALQILADDGLIRLEPYSGWHVLSYACNRRDKAAVSKADVALHQTIVDTGGNSRLANSYRRIQHQTQFLVESANAAMEIEDVATDHSEIVKAIIGGQSKIARSLAEGHGRRTGQELAEHVRRIGGKNPNQLDKAN